MQGQHQRRSSLSSSAGVCLPLQSLLQAAERRNGSICGKVARMVRDALLLQLDSRLASMFEWEEMPPLFMDTVFKPNSPGSLSPEESNSNTPGSEREGEGQQTGKRGTKRKDKNRDAARKSRKKQTERADDLHEELQHLEQSNSTLQKEIALLKRNLNLFRTVLEAHEPSCCLRDAASSCSSTAHNSISPSADCQAGSSPHQASTSSQMTVDSLSTSLTPKLSLQTLDCVESPHFSPSTPTLDSSTSSSSEAFTSSSSMTVPHSVSFSTLPVPHSLFSEDPPPIIASRLTNVTPLCSSSQAADVKSKSRQGATHDSSSSSANACFSAMDDFLMKQDSSLKVSSNMTPYSHVASENTGLLAQGCPMNRPQLPPGHFRGNPANPNPPSSHLLSIFQDPVRQSISLSRQVHPEPPPASAFPEKSSYTQDIAPNPTSLLSLLTTPSPLNVSTTTSSSVDEPQPQPLTSLPPLGNLSGDLSFSELLKDNDWILQ